ncbi:hypothetical protein N7532_002606 [Penicillium argentinense]|uniref:LysM domain-containing protein n=1 Tax=Penicillium argentinense TaxID=1131581 RepID=A0A9W9G0M7_9EURO|nr:uncharacterized protein N7532_002606 [Penicillium argentinense]KAJ5109961.1 hypothetical protein N7532_002606 [Penicillium argentinense]
MKGLAYFAVISCVEASHFAHQSLHHRATGRPNCKTYTVQDGDTCASIGKENGVTWAQLLSWNSDINSQCSNLGDLTGNQICVSNPSGNYVIPASISSASSSATGSQSIVTTTAPVPSPTVSGTNTKCAKYYQIGKDETCNTVVEKTGISRSDFLFLNPELNTQCTNLQKKVYYCVQAVGDISTYSGHPGSTSDNFSKVSMTSVPSSVPRPDYSGALKNNSHPVVQLATDTRKDCYDYMWLDNTTDNALADCWTMAMTNEISAEDFILWNPSLEKKSSHSSSLIPLAASTGSTGSSSSIASNPYNYPCTLRASSSYCVQLSNPSSTATSGSPTPSSVAASATQTPSKSTRSA